MNRRAHALSLAAIGLVAGLGVTRPPGLGDVVDVRHWSYPDYTRVVVEFDEAPKNTSVHRLAENRAAGRPERLYVDLEGVWVGRRYLDAIPVGDGLLRGVRLGQNTLRTTRLVIDLERYQHHRVLRLSSPDRVVVDVYGKRPGRAAPDASNNGASPRLPIEMRSVQTVVLDPGHGGRDPGAIGVGGLREKDVTLELARRLRRRLEKNDFEVVLTRDGDRTLTLEERTAIAAGSNGDLFISLHTNASRKRWTHGVETYFLDESNAHQSLRVAARENGVSPREFDDLQRTLAMLRVSEASDYSRTLADMVQYQIVQGLGQRYKRVEDLGVKKGPFFVLFLSSMPSILIEAGFITHKEEAKRLRNDKYLDSLADEIAQALVAYRKSVGTLVARSDL